MQVTDFQYMGWIGFKYNFESMQLTFSKLFAHENDISWAKPMYLMCGKVKFMIKIFKSKKLNQSANASNTVILPFT